MHLAVALALCAPHWNPPRPAPQEPVEIERLEAWPALEKDTLALVRTDIERLRKARTPEMGEEAAAALSAVGAGVVPELLPTLGKERDAAALARIEEVLVQVTDARHTRVLAAEFDAKDAAVRAFCLRRVSEFPDPGVREAAEAAWARVAKAGDKADRAERFAAALCGASSGSLAGFDELAARALERWPQDGTTLRAALAGVRGPEAAAKAVALLEGDRAKQVAGLNLLSACGDKESAPAVKPFLDSDDHQIRVAAINALRGMVDGQPPLDKLPVFEAIDMAKQWKNRV
jgi:hypothetical protein